jgi:outer membrane protein assembly factor BamB
MAHGGTTGDRSLGARKSRLTPSSLPRSPWQPEEPLGSSSRSDDDPVAWSDADVIDLGAPDEPDVIDLTDEPATPLAGPAARSESPGRLSRWLRGRVGVSTRGAHEILSPHDTADPVIDLGERPVADLGEQPVIDLGERHGEVSDVDVPVGPTPWRILDWRRVRPVTMVLVVFAAFVVGGSTAPTPERMPHISNISMPLGASLAVDGSRAVVLASRDGVGESVAAYNIAGGGRYWFTELPVRSSDDVGMTVADGTVLVTGGRLGGRGAHTMAVDERTGRLLWSTRLDLLSARRGSDTVLVSGGATSVMALDKRTGAAKWNLPVNSGCTTSLAVPDGARAPKALIELCRHGAELRRVNLDTGETDATRSLSLAAATDAGVTMFTVSNVVVVEDAGMKPPILHGYRLSDLGSLWSTPGNSPNDGAYACGSQVCVSSSGFTNVLDAHSGAVIPTFPHADEIAASVLQPFIPKSVVGTLLLAAPGAALPIVNRSTYVGVPVPDMAVVRPPLFRPGRTWVVTLSAVGVRDDVQFLSGPSADVCMPIGVYLGCMTSRQVMSFWKLPTVE